MLLQQLNAPDAARTTQQEENNSVRSQLQEENTRLLQRFNESNESLMMQQEENNSAKSQLQLEIDQLRQQIIERNSSIFSLQQQLSASNKKFNNLWVIRAWRFFTCKSSKTHP